MDLQGYADQPCPQWDTNPPPQYMSWTRITPDSRLLNPLGHHDQDNIGQEGVPGDIGQEGVPGHIDKKGVIGRQVRSGSMGDRSEGGHWEHRSGGSHWETGQKGVTGR